MISKDVLHQSVAVIPVMLNYIQEGLGYGWIAPTLLTLHSNHELPVSTSDLSWLCSSHELGKVIGSILSGLLLDRIGRKSVLLLCATLFFLSWSAISISTTILHICVARLIFGVGVGMNEVTISIYCGENLSPKLRAIFCSIILVIFYAFELIEFVISPWYTYKVVAAINAGIAFVGLLSMRLCKETPQYLLMSGNSVEAKDNYSWLRGIIDAETDIEFHQMRQNVEEEQQKKASYRELLSARANYRSLIIVSVLYTLTMATGGRAVLSYLTVFYSSDVFTPYEFVILFCGIRLLVAVVTPFYVERCGRRSILVGSFLLVTIIHLSTSALYCIQVYVTRLEYFPVYIFVTITLYASILTILSAMNVIVRGELFPQSIKAFGGFTSVSLRSVVAFFVTKTFITVKIRFGMQINFLFFAAMAFIAFLYTFLKLPETKSKTLVEIHKCLDK